MAGFYGDRTFRGNIDILGNFSTDGYVFLDGYLFVDGYAVVRDRITNDAGILNLGSYADTSNGLGIDDVIVGNRLEVDGMLWSDAGITSGGDIITTNASGPMLENAAASATNPTLIPNMASPTTGIGSSGSNSLAFITNGGTKLTIDTNGTANATGAWYWNDGTGATGAYTSWGSAIDTRISWNTTQTPDAWVFEVGTDSRNLLIIDRSDSSVDFAHALQEHPTMFLHSTNAGDITEWLSLAHISTHATVATGKGDLLLQPASQVVVVDGYVSFGSDAYVGANEDESLILSDMHNGPQKLVDLRFRQRKFEIYIDAYGDDSGLGTQADPIQSIRELTLRLPTAGEQLDAYFSAGEFRLTDHFGEFGFPASSRPSMGVQQGRLNLWGTFATITTFTISLFANPVLEAAGDPGWIPNEHVGRFIRTTTTLLDEIFTAQFVIIANTNNSLTFCMATGTPTGFPTSGDVSIIEPATIILPPLTNPGQFVNRFLIRGSIAFHGFIFADAAGGPTSVGSDCTSNFTACKFRNFSLRGVELSGASNIAGCVFEGCAIAMTSAISNSNSFMTVNNCWIDGSNVGIVVFPAGAYLSISTSSMIAARNVTTLFEADQGGFITDNSTRVYIQNVQDYIALDAGGTYRKAQASLSKIIDGYESPTRNIIRMTGINNSANLFSTGTATLTPAGAYIHLGGTDVTLAEYIADGYIAVDDKKNLVAN